MQNRLSCGVIIPSAGRGTRMDAAWPKQFMELEGKSILHRTIGQFQSSPDVDWIVVPAAKEEIDLVQGIVEKHRLSKVCGVVPGGERRQDSVWNGIKALEGRNPEVTLVHDAVRPFITRDLIHSLVLALGEYEGAVLAVPVKETMKLANDQRIITSTPERERVWIVQTPQGFRFPLLRRAYETAANDGFHGTDDASLVERMGVNVKIVEGSYDNIKITTPEDFELARLIVRRTTSGTPPVDSL
jgi:2-C-methyl-D-erythritol 4-phosphate cytidylyltransferase